VVFVIPRGQRFTPTGVGTTSLLKIFSGSLPVHPHGRGDDFGLEQVIHLYKRFTPTGVGTTDGGGVSYSQYTVHPHGRGDDLIEHGAQHVQDGSPPRAWGRLQEAASNYPSTRFTPTGVGTTTSGCALGVHTTVHPHGRGDDELGKTGDTYNYGSPPRAWGRRGIGRG